MLKVKILGIEGNMHSCIKNWLSNKIQKFAVNEFVVDWVPVTSSLPQRSLIGPVLFIIHINGIDVEFHFITKFADDTKI